MIYQRSLLGFMVVRNSTPSLFSRSPKFNPSDLLCLINVQLEQVLKEQGITLSNLWQVTFYLILNTSIFCMTVVCYCGRQLGYKYCERVNEGNQSPVHLKKLAVGVMVSREMGESGFWSACLS